MQVDRILLGLKKTGFDNFSRVGNLQRIDKRLLPHAVFPRFFAGFEPHIERQRESARVPDRQTDSERERQRERERKRER